VLNLIQFLEEIADSRQTVTLSPDEVKRLTERFGARVRQMGQWNNDGSLFIPMAAVTEAVEGLDNQVLAQALLELRSAPDRFPEMLENSSASILIDRISAAYLKNFGAMVTRFQETSDPAEADQLWKHIDEALFGR
jgi:hypothetical protein